MRERPILFSAPMVQALLAGRKTQTRRTVKGDIPSEAKDAGVFSSPGRAYDGEWVWLDATDIDDASFIGEPFRCPYGQPGDVLWVKETFRLPAEYDHLKPTLVRDGVPVWYEADGRAEEGWGKTRVSLHMQRRFSRLALCITDVRVQRLNECSDADALAEGVVWSTQWHGFVVPGIKHPNPDFPVLSRATAREMYAALWDTINGSGEWLANPWVWAVSFEIMKEGA